MPDDSTFGGEDDILALSDAELDDLGDGLKLDERQASEIQSIFLTTLPQYLEPVAEMLDQLLADSSDEEARSALEATLSSLVTASARIGVEAAGLRLKRMHQTVAALSESDDIDEDTAEQLRWDLDELRKLSGSADTGDSSPTLVSILRGKPGVEDGVLSRLTAAGVVTAEQMLMARDDEIASVSGLDQAVVARLLSILREHLPDSDGSENVVQLDVGDGALQKQLESRLRAQVDAEAARDEVAAKVQRLRRDTEDLRIALDAGHERLSQLEAELSRAEKKLYANALNIRKLAHTRDELVERRQDTDRRIMDEEQRILELRRERKARQQEQAEFREEMAKLMKRMARVLKIAEGRTRGA